MSDHIDDIVAMARAAYHDERLADGSLYGKLADRRERIATAFMAALLPQKGWDYLSPQHAAKDALRYADALIDEIDREAKP